MKKTELHQSHGNNKLLFLSLAALGVVYGDIGTSPLYAINEIFFGPAKVVIDAAHILGCISLVFWALTIIVSFKYVFFVLRADAEGEGGVFALFSLISRMKEHKTKFTILVSSFLIFAAGLLFGDGIITPAISVISAVEGLKAVTESLTPYIVPITILILTGLFFIQYKGTAKVGTIFGPIVLLWFLVIGALGFVQVLHSPLILEAINPLHAIYFLTHSTVLGIALVLGSVMLTVTGGEAMYADMGHFGRKPIRLSWFVAVYPALLLNYFGQGAFLLSGARVMHDNIFYSMVPSWGLIPMVVLATFATIIASQALISGAFSLATQAITLGLFPRLKVVHTHHEHEGQQYVPFINWSLYVGCVILVLIFRSSSALASAYGLAVSGVMLVTTLSMIIVTQRYWKWSALKSYLLFIPLLLVDFSFFASNSVKIFEGGFIPLGIAVTIWFFMRTWAWGRKRIRETLGALPSMTVTHLINIKKNSDHWMPKTVILMTPRVVLTKTQSVSALKQMYWERYGLLPKHLIFLSVRVLKEPFLHENRYEVNTFYENPEKGSIRSIVVNFGFMEELNVEKVLFAMAADHKLPIGSDASEWLVHVINERISGVANLPFLTRIRVYLFKLMLQNSIRADQFFGLGNKVGLTVEVLPAKFH